MSELIDFATSNDSSKIFSPSTSFPTSINTFEISTTSDFLLSSLIDLELLTPYLAVLLKPSRLHPLSILY